MIDDPREPHRTALELADLYVHKVRPEDLSRPTPCAGWDVAQLLAHMIGQQQGFARAVREGAASSSAHAPVPFSPDAWGRSVNLIRDAFAGADLEATVVVAELSSSALPVRRVIRAQLLDTVVHTWDVSQALGETFVPDEELATEVLELAGFIPRSARGTGGPFGEQLPRGGTTWEQALALVGRAAARDSTRP